MSNALTTPFALTLVTATKGHVTKKLVADVNGQPSKDPAWTLGVSAGRVEHVQLAGLDAFADWLPTLATKQALIHGTPIGTVPGCDALTLVRKANYTGRPGTITRTLDHFAWPEGPHLLMFDYDPDPEHPDGVENADTLMAHLARLDPAFAACGWLVTTSTSSAIKSHATGDWLTPPRGMHLYMLVVGDVPRFKTWLTVKLWCAKHGYVKLSKPTNTTGITGRLARTLLDLAVLSAERLDYVAGALIDKGAPFYQDRPPPARHAGGVLDLDALPPLAADEEQRYRTLLQEARDHLEPDRRQAVRARLDPALPAERIEEEVTARLAQGERRELAPAHVLYFDNGTTRTVEELRTRAGRTVDGLHLRDPLFADDPGAAVFHWREGDWRINSWYTGDMVTFRAARDEASGAQDDAPDAPTPDPDEPPPEDFYDDGDARAHRSYGLYRASPRGLSLTVPATAKRKAYVVQLTNFDAEITASITRDDGSGELRKVFDLTAIVAHRQVRCQVNAEDFGGMRWVTPRLGPQAVVHAGSGTQDHARAAIQLLSTAIHERHVYEHTGWTTFPDGSRGYLHGGGASTASGLREDITVDLPGLLSRYHLPPPGAGDALQADAIRHSLALRHVLDDGAMVPLLGGTYLAPLRQLLLPHDPPDFVLWLYGPTGSYKSETAALCLNHYGETFSGKTLPGSFVATDNALERMAFATKDALLVVDDFHPATNRKESESMAATVSRLLRGVGNGTGRARMNSDTTARPDLPPRCVVLATGERLPDGHSTNARMFLVSIAPPQHKAETAARLTEAQRHRESYARAMSGYLAWLAGKTDTFQRALTERFSALRDAARADGSHARQPGAVAHLTLAWETWTQYAMESGAITAAERDALLGQVWTILCTAAQVQADSLLTLRPDQRALDLWLNGLAGKRCYLETLDGTAPDDAADWGWTREEEQNAFGIRRDTLRRPPGGILLGYVAADWLYLLPEVAYQFLCKAARDAGEQFPVDLKTLLKALDEAGLIETHRVGGQTRRTVQQRFGGLRLRVIKLKRALSPVRQVTAGRQVTAQPLENIGAYPVVTCVTCEIAPGETCMEDNTQEEEREEDSTHTDASTHEEGEGEDNTAYATPIFTGDTGDTGDNHQYDGIDTGGYAVTCQTTTQETQETQETTTIDTGPTSAAGHPGRPMNAAGGKRRTVRL